MTFAATRYSASFISDTRGALSRMVRGRDARLIDSNSNTVFSNVASSEQ